MTPIRRAWHLSRGVLGVAVIAVLAASCGASHAASPVRSTSTSTTTTATNATLAAVLAAYRAGWQAFEQAVDQADPTLPALAQTMTGAQLQSVRRALVADKADGIVGRGNVALHPKVFSVSGDQAVVLDCAFDSSELVYAETGKPVPPVTPPEKVAVRSQLTTFGGVWKVAEQHTTGGSCPPGY
ncbi:MAG: hypothetical protein ACRDYB_13710 [Acidimicrobiales bacterium]